VLAVDISNSMDPEEQALQREGIVAAFRSPVVHDAIRKGALGRVAVTYMEWAGTVTQQVVVPWAVIEGRCLAVRGSVGCHSDQACAPHLNIGSDRLCRAR
jgi:hypothetical protein